MKLLEKWEDGCRRQMLSWNTLNISHWDSIKLWQPKLTVLQDLQTWKGRQIIQGKHFIQCKVGGTITTAPST